MAPLPSAAQPVLARAALLSSPDARALGIGYRDQVFFHGIVKRLVAAISSDYVMPAPSLELLEAGEALSKSERREIRAAAAAAVRGAAHRGSSPSTAPGRVRGLPGRLPRLAVAASTACLLLLTAGVTLARDQRLLAEPILVLTGVVALLVFSVGLWELGVDRYARLAVEAAAVAAVANDRTGKAFLAASGPWDAVVRATRLPASPPWERFLGFGVLLFIPLFVAAVLAVVGDPASTLSIGLFAIAVAIPGVVACLAVGLHVLGRRTPRGTDDGDEGLPFESEVALLTRWRTARIRRPNRVVRVSAAVGLLGAVAALTGSIAGVVTGTYGRDDETTVAEALLALGVLALIGGAGAGVATRALVVWRSDDRDLRHRWLVAVAQLAIGIPAAFGGSYLVGLLVLGPAIDSGGSNPVAAVVAMVYFLVIALVPVAIVNILWATSRGRSSFAWAPPTIAFGLPIVIGLALGVGP